MLIRPDRRMYTKALLILATITLAAALSTGLAHLAMTVFDADNLATATTILWAVYGGGDTSTYWPGAVASAVIVLVVFSCGLWYFRRTERTFADVI